MMSVKSITMGCATLLLTTVAVGYIAPSASSQGGGTVLPSELVAHPEKYDGKHVDVRGYIVLGPETRDILDSEKSYNDPHAACLGLDGPEEMFDGFHRRYTRKISGVFRRVLCGKNDICLYWCGISGIELDKDSKP
jgi:hypothetical protein